jgi:hypothetical protein
MNADQLIRALAADPPARSHLNQSIALIAGIGVAVAIALFFMRIGLRPNLATAIHDPRVMLKFLAPFSAAVATAGLLLRVIRPGMARGWWSLALLTPLVLLALGIVGELSVYPVSEWYARLVGRYSSYCLKSIPLLATPILIALLFALRRGAPMRPSLAGALAGLLAGTIGATIYAAHCPDDSPLFLMTWYGLSVAMMTLAGALLGARVLRW